MAFSPCQITGFFRIHDESKDLAKIGSTGAGVNIEQGVRTTVSLRKSSKRKSSVRLNGRPLQEPIVSNMVIDDYLASAQGSWEVLVDHNCFLPVGSGYGTSGAGAASLSLALNYALGEPCSRSAALRIAHTAEVKAKTGLGTVASVSAGGLAVRVTPGAPGIGRIEKVAIDGSSRVVSGTFGPISTRQILSSEKLRDKVNTCSARLVGNLLRKPDAGNFMRLSKSFTSCLGLASARLRRFLGMAETQGIGASMMMLGEGAFCIAPVEALEMAEKLFHWGDLSPTVSRIYSRGAHLA